MPLSLQREQGGQDGGEDSVEFGCVGRHGFLVDDSKPRDLEAQALTRVLKARKRA